jgi:hypothetical protein
MMTDFFGRVFGDFFAYLVFLGSFYIVFSTNLYFRYFLIPLTLFAFFHAMSNKFKDGFVSAKQIYESEELKNIVSGDVFEKSEKD